MESKFWDVFSPGPVLDTLCDCLTIGDIVNLSRTCRGLSGIYHETVSRQWDIDNLLKRFVCRPRGFRKQIGLAEALITGSLALEFFERPHWQASNLDIVVKDRAGVDALRDYLALGDDYNVLDEVDDNRPYNFRHVERVTVLQRNISAQPLEIRLYEISNHAFPVKSIIEGAWTTSVVNFISWRKAYSFFPSSTFVQRKSFMLERPYRVQQVGELLHPPVQKYKDRGYAFEIERSALETRRNHPMQRLRKAGDKYTWRISLNIDDIDIPYGLDPVPEDEYIYITEESHETEIDEASPFWPGLEQVSSVVGVADIARNAIKAFHYEAKWMRYTGFFT